jgi:hypothetical protein
MSVRMGKDGFISFDSSSGTTGATSGAGTTQKPTYIDSWTLTENLGMAEVTAFGDQWRKYQPTVKGYTVTASGNLDKGSTELQGAALMPQLDATTNYTALAGYNTILRLYESTAYWFGKARLQNVKISETQTGNIAVTYTLAITSGLQYITT